MLSDIEFLDEAFKGILHHHERIDGLGYPMGLRGAQIPEFARVIAVADAFDSMTSTRSYRGARRSPRTPSPSSSAARARSSTRAWSTPWCTRCAASPGSRTEVPAADDEEFLDAAQAVFADHDDPTVAVAAREERP